MRETSPSVHSSNTEKHPRSVLGVHTGYPITKDLATVMSKESKVAHVAEGSRGAHCQVYQPSPSLLKDN